MLYDRLTENREEIGERLKTEKGATLVKPYDDPMIIAGQGTIGLEIAQQSNEMGFKPDVVIVPAGGGGLVGIGRHRQAGGGQRRTNADVAAPTTDVQFVADVHQKGRGTDGR